MEFTFSGGNAKSPILDSSQASHPLDSKTKRLQRPVKRSQFYNTLVELLEAETSDLHSDTDNGSRNNSKSNIEVGETQLNKVPTWGLRTDEPSAIDVAINGTFIESVSLESSLSAQKPLRILIAEDILLNQKVALKMLSTYGYQADVAHNGKEAVVALQNQSYDLVFMDVQMPEMDGLKATQTIRADPTIEQPYIVAMTAHAMQGDRANCLSVGMNNYVRKPIRRRDLAAVIRQCPASRKAEKISERPLEKTTSLAETLSNLPTLDTTVLEGFVADSSFLKEVCDSFLNDAPKQISQIKIALDQADAAALDNTAHALKSLSGCIGARALWQLCQRIEGIGKRNCTESAVPLFAQLEHEYEQVQLALQAYKASC